MSYRQKRCKAVVEAPKGLYWAHRTGWYELVSTTCLINIYMHGRKKDSFLWSVPACLFATHIKARLLSCVPGHILYGAQVSDSSYLRKRFKSREKKLGSINLHLDVSKKEAICFEAMQPLLSVLDLSALISHLFMQKCSLDRGGTSLRWNDKLRFGFAHVAEKVLHPWVSTPHHVERGTCRARLC